MLKTVTFALALLAPATSLAQGHPCDQPPLASQTIQSGAPHKVQFCAPASDNIEALVAFVDTVASSLQAATAKTAPSTTGKILYESPMFLQVTRGNHVLTVATYNRDGFTGTLQIGPQSAPFSFAAVDNTPLPAAAEIKGVVR